MTFQLTKATRQKTKIKLGLSGPSGSGKTYSALLLAKGIAGDWSKIAVIDTENGSADLYADLGDYNTLTLSAPYTPERYIEAIKTCENAGMEVIILDSMSHEWDGKGGILEIHGNMVGNSFTNWAKVTPRHNAFIDAILQSPVHFICTMRSKQDYVLDQKDGKSVPQKVGLKAITREGVDYEFTLVFDIDIKHHAVASKDRTGIFVDQPEFIITEETGWDIKTWTDLGVDSKEVKKPVKQSVTKPTSSNDVEDYGGDIEDSEEVTDFSSLPFIMTPGGSKLSNSYLKVSKNMGISEDKAKAYILKKFKLESYSDVNQKQLTETFNELKKKETEKAIDKLVD